jgi:hypothetical protein
MLRPWITVSPMKSFGLSQMWMLWVAVGRRVLINELDREGLFVRGGQAVRRECVPLLASTAMCNLVPCGSQVTSALGAPEVHAPSSSTPRARSIRIASPDRVIAPLCPRPLLAGSS